jgi:carboxypeptidase family protein
MNRKLRTLFLLVAACLVLVWCIPSVGQVLKGSISGTVQDPQGAVVSGAQVKATNTSTGVTLTTTSDSAGLYRFNLIPVGEYKVEISAQGFKTAVQSNILVTAGRDSGLGGTKLTVGETSTTIEVSGAAPLIETTQSQVTNTFSGTALTTFAGIQENQGLDNLALFVPGVVSVRDNSFSNTNGGQGFSSNGLRGRNNDQEIDGQNNNDNSVAGPGLFLSDTEFVQQYVLITNQFGPEYGRNAGSVVNIITKSGTNAWHGSIYENENMSNLNSLNVQQKNFDTDANGNPLTKQPRLNDEFGGFTVGGPIVKNKAFLFGGFDQEIVSTKSIFHSDALTPTPTGLAQLAACPALNANSLAVLNHFGPYAISGGNPFPTVDPTTKQFTNQDILDPSGTTVLCPGVQFGGVTRILQTPTHNFNFVNRFDYQRGNDNFMARYLFNRGNNFNIDFGDGAAGYPVSVPALSQAFLLGWTHNLSSRMVNEARVGFNRLNVDFGGNTIGTVPTADQVGNTVAHVSFNQPGVSNLAIGPANNFPQLRIVNTWQAQDNWNYVVGKHTFKAGVNYTFQRSPNIFLPNLNGTFRFPDWSGFFNNTPNRIQIAAGDPTLDFREHDTFIYGGDDWKIGNTLTLNLGLTWSYYGQPANLFNNITVPRESNPATALWANTSTPFTTGNPTSPINGQPIPLSVRTFPVFPSPKNSWGPSLGFAWNPQGGGILTGNGKTTIRGGYRLLYDPPFGNIYTNMSSSAPEVFLQTIPSPATHPMPSDITGPNVRNNFSSFIQRGVFDPRQFADTTMSPDFGPDRVHSWSFGIEREVTKNSAVEARYVGNRGTNLFQTVNGNPDVAGLQAVAPNLVPAGVTPCPANQAAVAAAIGRVDCNQGVVRLRNNGGYSDYNGVQVEFRANNLFKQLTVRTGYTFSKTLDNVSEIFSTGAGANSTAFAQNPFNTTTAEHSFSGLDIPHTWTILFTEELPFFKEQHGFAGHVLGGWEVSGNYILASGQRYTPVQGVSAFLTDALLNGTSPYDLGFINNFVGFDLARPFLGSMSAPQTSVGMFAGDACFLFSFSGTDPLCVGDPNQLISLTSVGRSGCETDPTKPCPFTPVQNNQVRFIVNSATSQQVFGTPFGNMPRNLPQDAISNVANVSVMKRLKISERNSFELRFSMLNAFNHPNFTSVDPFVEDAGLSSSFTGFGDPSLTGSAYPGFNGATRRINFGATFRF